jgi:hypothetical protein
MDHDIVAVFPFKSSHRQDAHCFGIIKSFDASTNRFKVEVMLARESAFHADMSEALRQQPKLKILRIDSILSTLRELDAIAQLGKHQLLPCILRGEFAPMRELTQAERMLIQSQVQRFRQLNESQRQALKYCALLCTPPASLSVQAGASSRLAADVHPRASRQRQVSPDQVHGGCVSDAARFGVIAAFG